MGIETAFPLLYTCLVREGVLTLSRIVELMAAAPRRRFGIPFGVEYTLWDMNRSGTVDPASFLSKGRATPFEGWPIQGRCLLTVCDGRTAYGADFPE